MKNAIEITGLHKQYPGFHLRDVTVSVPAGFVTGLIGANGAGKTTLIKLILGAVRKDSGSIRVFGVDQERDEVAGRQRMGFVHEIPPTYDFLTGRRFARIVRSYYPCWDSGAFARLAADFGLPLGKRISTYSRGMKMKLALALALCHEADLLVMDEPTSGLDPVFRRELLDRLRGYLRDEERTILFSTHITSDLESIADHVVLLAAGEVCLSESAESLRERWRIVKGGLSDLVTEVLPLLQAVEKHAYGFTALTETPAQVEGILGDLVYSVDGGGADA